MVVPEAVALEIPAAAEEGSPPPAARVPPRIRRRLLRAREGGGTAPTAEEIEAKLREAHLRRQQFHETLSSKARRSIRSPSGSSQKEDRGQLLEAKLVAAKQKRLSLLAKEQSRLAKLDELRQAAKNNAETRFEREREELGMRVESRVRQAEKNRMELLHARLQRQAALEERTKKFFVQRLTWENKYRERVRSAILQKRTAAEKRRSGLLESEKRQAQGRLLQVQLAAKTASSQRETERSKLKEQLEDKLQRQAKQQRVEYLKQRGSPYGSIRSSSVKSGEFLSRKLARCWRRFITSRKTTVVLARAFDSLGINQQSVVSMPFEELAICIESPTVLQTTKALLDRLESRFVLSQSFSSSKPENIDHLLKHLGSPKRRILPSSAGRSKVTPKKAVRNNDSSKVPRYSQRIALCAYMILGHPKSVLSGQGEREKLLMDSATNFVKEFELLVKTILDALDGACILKQSELDVASPGCSSYEESSSIVADRKKFRTQLVAFDKAWCAYLYHFVVWKAKDAESLEEDLIRAACRLELSMIQTCKITNEGQSDNFRGNLKAIQKQVAEDQKLLRERIQHLGGEAGIERMESALSETRSKFFQAKEGTSSIATTVANIASPSVACSPGQSTVSEIRENSNMDAEKTNRVVNCLFGSSSSPSDSSKGGKLTLSCAVPEKMPTENEQIVNEILHGIHGSFADISDGTGTVEGDFKAKVKETMEKAFWDVVEDSMRGDMPDYSYLVSLVKEVKEALQELAPTGWKEEISENINLEILTQALKAEVSRARIQLLEPIIKGSGGVEYLQKSFADRYGSPSDALASLPSTACWISSVKDIVEEQWNEHVSSLSILPAANHVQPLVATLRTGLAVPGHLQSAISAAGSTELPECTGEGLGRLIRIGLLQLISSTEGLQSQTVPETFMLNWMRLRSVQSKFQQVIVIATSMLVMHQVLVNENPNISPPELENVTLELFNMLTSLLDNFVDVGTEKIIEAMMHSSTSTSSSSNKMIETRKQILTRVFLKSLQTDDTVFKKVSQSVYCAFRAVTLGGSGEKGRKLADASLRRIGATKLTERVVKAAEVLMKAAMVSEQVHGPWYRQLL
uniref:T-complex protein 11 n=1 Tax=Setaria italica TaxID=4555 RepID=K3YPG8_SETIT